MNSKTVSIVVIIAAAYVAAQMIADVASLRIVEVAGFSVDAGTLVYPFTFTLRDLVHKVTSKHVARTLIFTAAVINLVMAGVFWIASVLPADTAVGPQAEFAFVLSPVWRIVLASIVAEVLAELVDGEVYEQWVEKVGQQHQWGRVLASNTIAVPLDSAVFCAIAFGGVFPVAVVFSIFWANVIVKGATTLLSIPLIYTVPEVKSVVVTSSP